jgi:signal transduction histidine kinase/ligand-binding sensor domain-containing protein/DNA-binding response OmpR family regulator
VVFIHFEFLFANSGSIKIEDYSYKDGLTTSGVFNALKDSKGFLWLCTMNGLFRFDGYSFRNINTIIKDNLNSVVFCITEDIDHNFWVGTTTGLFYYDTRTERLYSIRTSLNKNFFCHQILISKNRIWVASSSGLLLINYQKTFNPDTILQAQILLPDSMHERTTQDNIINVLYYTSGSQSLWVGTNGALYELNIKNLVFKTINSFSQNSIRGISKYNNGIIVSSWDGGVFFVNSSKHIKENDSLINEANKIIGDKRVMSAISDSQNHLWVATNGFGLFVFEKSRNGVVSYVNYRNDQKLPENLKSDFINQMYYDNTGIVWLCMNQPALSKVYFQNSNMSYFDFFKQANNNYLREILAINQSIDRNKLWVTSNGDGIYLFDTRSNKFKLYANNTSKGLRLHNNELVFCYQDRKGNLWIVYRKIGLYVVPSKIVMGYIEGNLNTIFKPVDANLLISKDRRVNSYITTFFEDNAGRFWIGGWGSLYVIDFKHSDTDNFLTESTTTCVLSEEIQNKINFPISPVLSILEIKKNQYWLGMFGAGIIQVDEISKNSFSFKQLEINKKLPATSTKFVIKDKSDGIWIGTNSGLCYWNLKTDSFKIITEKNGLSSNNINNIVEDNNSNIWVSTSYGISEIKSKAFSILSFFNTDKEKCNQYINNAGALTSEGLVYFSTNEALVMINPDSVEIRRHDAPLYFTDIKIDNMTVFPLVKYNGTIVIKSNINECKIINVPYNHTLNIEFAALDLKNPKRLLYKYQIGNNNEWILLNSNQRSLSLPNMKHGEYTLNIRLADSQDEKNILSIKLKYLPPFWLSLPALLMYFVVLVLLIFFYRKQAIQKVLQKSIIEKERYERKKLEELDKMKTEFFSNISHEFRTPLSLIINPLEILVKDNKYTEKDKERFNLILKSSNRLLKLTNELMEFSKIEKKLLVPEFQICEIVELVKDICSLFNNLSDSMNIEYKINCPFDEPEEIPIDKGMIEKALFNLLSNAFKYTPVNGVVMVNLTKCIDNEMKYVKISVINTGEGIAKENIMKVFDRFYQVNNVQNHKTEGTGIGLALVKSYVELHDGKVEVKSEPNLETCFDVYLPMKQITFNYSDESKTYIPDNILKTGSLDLEIEKNENKPTSHYRLLLVEDEDDIKKFILDELSADFKITTAKNGEEGVNLANEMVPDLIITDIMMPVMSGIELCRILKNQMSTSHIPIIVLSAKTNIAQQIEGLEMGADVYMIKPFSIEHLKIQILRLINFKENIYSRYLKDNTIVPQGTVFTKLDEEFMKKVLAYIEANLSDAGLNVDQIANCVSLSKVQTYRKTKAITGLSIVEFIRTVRLKKAAELVIEKRLNFTEIAFETGFSSLSYFTRCFHDHYGKSPTEFNSDYGNK